jgi:hypothetical protein
MATTKNTGASVEIRRDEDGPLVHYGFVQDGVFHPVAAERKGDFDERVKAAQEDSE